MFTHTLKKLPKNTSEIHVSVTWDEVQKEYEKAFAALQGELPVEGFRKGKAPKAIAEKHIGKDTVYQKLINNMLPAIYEEVVKKEDLKPIVAPKVEVVKAKEKEDWEFKITVAERPEIVLKDYKKKIQEINEKSKKSDIWVPGKGEPSEVESVKRKEEQKQQNLNAVLSTVLSGTECEISELILEEELNNRLSKLVDDVQKLGLSVESYLKTKNTTMEELRAKISKEIEETYKLEFVLGEIAEKEKITVEQRDLETLFGHIKDEKEKKAAQDNAYFYASILRKQKTLEFLRGL